MMAFNPPTPVYDVDAENVVVLESVHELIPGAKVAIENPWSEEDRYLIGLVRGLPGKYLLEIGRSLGTVEKTEEGYVCTALVRMEAVAEGLALEEAEKSKTFTQRLLSKTSKKRKKSR
jgi:hypothetical protein